MRANFNTIKAVSFGNNLNNTNGKHQQNKVLLNSTNKDSLDKFESTKEKTDNGGLISTIKKPFTKVRGLIEYAINDMGGPNMILANKKNRFLNPVLYYVSKGM